MTNSLRSTARLAGFFYLLIIASGLFSQMVVRQGLLIPGDAAASAQSVFENLFLFRLGFLSDLLMAVCDAAVGLLFYFLLRSVNRRLALSALVFRLIQATIIGLNMLNQFSVVLLLENGIQPGDADQLMFFMGAHTYGYLISGVFFGISCLILGRLFYKSSIFPSWLGIALGLAGIAYLTDCVVRFLLPEYGALSEMGLVILAVPTELALCLYLLIKGVKKT